MFQDGIGGDVRQPGRFLAPERTSLPPERLDIAHADFRGHGKMLEASRWARPPP